MSSPNEKRQGEWDARYAGAAERLFGGRPNDYVCVIAGRPGFDARSALLLADGDGRNGTWLASQGVSVTAIDFSAEATQQAIRHDEAAGVQVERQVDDLEVWKAPAGSHWDAVFVIHFHGSVAARRRSVEMGWDALAPGGWLVLEGFAKEQATFSAMGPNNADKLWSLEELTEWVPDALVMESLTGTILLDEGPRHRGQAQVVRFAGRKS